MVSCPRSITQWIVGVSAVGVASIGGAVAQAPPEQSKVIGQEVSTSEIDLPLSDHQRTEVIGTLALKSSDGFSKLQPSAIVVAGYATAFFFLSLTLQTMPLESPTRSGQGPGRH
jgi:hypothetical protein